MIPIFSKPLELVAANDVAQLVAESWPEDRKNALFAGSDDGGDHWAVIASMIETCKLNDIDPQAWLTDTLTRLAASYSNLRRDELMPWNYMPDVG